MATESDELKRQSNELWEKAKLALLKANDQQNINEADRKKFNEDIAYV